MAQRSLCVRAQVGAVIVDARNRIVETGYNGPPRGFQHDDQPCTQWCPRASAASKPIGWTLEPTINTPSIDYSVEYTNVGADVVFSGGRRVPFTAKLAAELGMKPTFSLSTDYSDCPALHAEANALMVCDRSSREGGTIYVTSHVCYGCAKLIANSGLAAVVVALATDERDRAYRDPDKSYALLEQCGLEVIVEAL